MGLDDTENIATLLQHIRAGCDIDKSCTVSRVRRSSYYRWLKEADEILADVPPEDRSDYHRKVLTFAEAVELAKAQSVTSLELVIAQAARSDWRAAAAMLKKHEAGSWNGRTALEITGKDGGPIAVTAAPQPDMTDADEARAIWEARAEMGDLQAARLLAALDA
jgi:hypothetical protein